MRFLTRTEKFVYDVLRNDFRGYAESFFVYKGFLVRKNRTGLKEVTVDRVIVQFVERLISVLRLEKLFSALSFSKLEEFCYAISAFASPGTVPSEKAEKIIIDKTSAFASPGTVPSEPAGVISCTKEYSIYQA